jgi:hypothetical protein
MRGATACDMVGLAKHAVSARVAHKRAGRRVAARAI